MLGMEFMRTYGANPIQGNTIAMNSPEAIEGLKVQRGLVTSGISPQAVAEYMEGTVEGPFLAGDSVFLRNWNYMFGVFPDPKQSKVHPSQVGVAAVPRASTSIAPVNVGGGWNIYINEYSKNQDAAWKLIQFMTSPAQQLYTFNTIAYVPTLSSLINSPTVAKQNPFSGPALARADDLPDRRPAEEPLLLGHVDGDVDPVPGQRAGQGHSRAGSGQSSDPARADRQAGRSHGMSERTADG